MTLCAEFSMEENEKWVARGVLCVQKPTVAASSPPGFYANSFFYKHVFGMQIILCRFLCAKYCIVKWLPCQGREEMLATNKRNSNKFQISFPIALSNNVWGEQIFGTIVRSILALGLCVLVIKVCLLKPVTTFLKP